MSLHMSCIVVVYLFTVNLSEQCSRKYIEKYLHNSQDVCRDKLWMTKVRKWVFARTHNDRMKQDMCLYLSHRKYSTTYTHCCRAWPINIRRDFSAASMCCASWNWTAPIHQLEARWLTTSCHCGCPWRCTSIDQRSVIRSRALHLWGPNHWRLCFRLHKPSSRS